MLNNINTEAVIFAAAVFGALIFDCSQNAVVSRPFSRHFEFQNSPRLAGGPLFRTIRPRRVYESRLVETGCYVSPRFDFCRVFHFC